LDAIQHKKERGMTCGEESVQRDVGIAAHFSRHALVSLADFIQPRSRHTLNWDALLYGKLEAVSQRAFFLRTFGYNQLKDLSPPGEQTLVNRIASVKQLAHSIRNH
jgi:hypothetical protein